MNTGLWEVGWLMGNQPATAKAFKIKNLRQAATRVGVAHCVAS